MRVPTIKANNLWIFSILCLFVFLEGFVYAEESRFGARGLGDIPVDRLDEGCELGVQTGLDWWENDINWAMIEPEEPVGGVHSYRWDGKDKRIKASLDHNTGVVSITVCDSTWGANVKAECDSGIPLPEHESDYQEFIRSVVERYDGDGIDDAPFVTAQKNIKYWIVDNEPGTMKHWCAPNCDYSVPPEEFSQCVAQQYAAHLTMTAEAIKNADPTAIVAPAGIGSYAILYLNFMSYMLETLQQSGTDVDFIAYHSYLDLETIPIVYDTIQDSLVQYGFGIKPIWLTETNFNSTIIIEKFGIDDPHSINKEEFDVFVAGHLIKRYAYAFSSGTQKVFMNKLIDDKPWPGDTSIEHWGMLDTELNPKPVYYSHQTMTSKLKGFSYAEQITKPDYYLFRFNFENNGSMFIAWSDNPITANLGLGRVKITDMYGNETIQDSSSLALTDLPVFIETDEVVKIISPDGGGEILTSGTSYTIEWQTNREIGTSVATAKLFYTKNGGITWKRITSLTGNPGRYIWTVPQVTSAKTQCRIKVVLKDTSGQKVGKDKSDSYFIIQPAP
jgi:hypothetical protein